MSEETKEPAQEAQPDVPTPEADAGKPVSAKKKRKKWPIVVGVVAAVIIVAGAGFMVWHEQPSFCNAICHTPMDVYNETYDQDYGVEGTDKWGNTVTNTASMMAVSHKELADNTCLDCHVPTMSEQINEGIEWVTGNYYYPLTERSLTDLTEARGIADEEFCLNSGCHTNEDGTVMTRSDLVEATSDMSFNPHISQHGTVDCSECHKAHRASVLYCSNCHDEAELPDGWITVDEEKQLTTV